MLHELMNQTLIIERPTVPNKYGESSHISITVKCRLEFAERLIKTPYGETPSSIGGMSTVQLYSSTKLNRGDKTTIEEVSYKVERVDTIKDITGRIMHYEAYLI